MSFRMRTINFFEKVERYISLVQVFDIGFATDTELNVHKIIRNSRQHNMYLPECLRLIVQFLSLLSN